MPRLKKSFRALSFKQKNRFKGVFLGLMLILSYKAESQQIINLPAYTHKHLHFGFIIAVNTASFYVVPTPNLAEKFKDTLKTIRSVPQAGFDLGIVSEIG